MRCVKQWLIAGLMLPLLCGAAEVEVSANRDQIYLGESFILQMRVTGADGKVDPDLSQIRNARIRHLDRREISNYNITIVNGRMVREGFSGLVISYEVTPQLPGTFRAGPVALEVDGRRLEDAGPVLEVMDVSDQDDVKIVIEASRETVLVGEPFDVRLRVLIRRLPGDFAHIDPLFPDDPPVLTASFLDELPHGLKGVDLQELLQAHLVRRSGQPGLALNEYTLADSPLSFRGFFESLGERRRARFAWPRTAVTVADMDYFAYELELRLVPEEENDYVFGPVVFKGQVPVAVDAQGRAEGRYVFAVGKACTVRVTPPPEEGRPASFTGGIGKDMRVSAGLDCLSCNVGDPVKLTLEIEGDLRFDRMLPPRLSQQSALLEDFTVYDQTVETMVDSESNRRYVYSIRPRRAGLLEVPALEAAYFDTADREYHLRYTQPVPLEVRPGIAFSAEQIIGAVTGQQDQADEAPLPAAALAPGPLWTDDSGIRPGRLLPGPGLWAVALAGPWCCAMVWLVQAWHNRRAARRVAQRRAAALPQARQALRKLRSLPEHEAVALVCPLVRKFLGALLDCPTAGLTPVDLHRLLAEQGLSPELITSTIELYQRYFDAGFHKAPVPNLAEDIRALEIILPQTASACRMSGGVG